MPYEIKACNTDQSTDDDEITLLAGPWGPEGEPQTKSVDEVLKEMAKGHMFYTLDRNRKRTEVRPVHLRNANFARTNADRSVQNNLEALPDCARYVFEWQTARQSRESSEEKQI